MNKVKTCKDIKHFNGFKCVRKIGEGGFGKTFLMKKGDKNIVLKVIYKHNEDFKNEVTLLKKLSKGCHSKHILCYYSKYTYGYNNFLVSEYINGVDFWKYSSKSKKIYYKLFRQLFDAVKHIHSKKIIHFDIKPENIIISKDNNLKLIDFGAASTIDNKGKVTAKAYTEEYSMYDSRPKNISFKKGILYDQYSLIYTIYDIVKKRSNTPKELLLLFKGGSSIKKVFNEIKNRVKGRTTK
jgi:serine/threonine protein kinase